MRPSAWTAAVLVAAVTLALPGLAQDSVTRAYDVGFLTRQIDDNPGPDVGLELYSGGGHGVSIGGDEAEGVTVDRIATIVKANIDPVTWNKPNYIKQRGSVLLIRASATTHTKVKALLAWARSKHSRAVKLEIRVYEGPASALSAIYAGGPVLDAARVKALGAAPWKRVRAAVVTAFSNQRVHLANLQHVRYLRDYDVEVAENSMIFDPEISTLALGTVDDVRPVLSDDGNALMVEVRQTVAAAKTPLESFDTGLTSPKGQKYAKLEQPEVDTRKVRNTVWMPAGGSSVVAAQVVGESIRLTVIRHHPDTTKLPAMPKADGKRALRILDARYALFTPNDFKGPSLEIASAGSGGAAGAVFEAAEDGTRLDTDSLVDMIRSSVDEDSWHNTRNRLDTIAGRLVVHQTSDTLDAVEAYLQKLEKVRGVSILIRARLFTPGAAQREAVLGHVGQTLSAEALARYEALFEAGKEIAPLDDLTVVGLPDQRVYSSTLRSRLYVKDYDVEIAQDSRAQDPEVGQFDVGTTLDVRPLLVQSEGKVLLEMRIHRAELTRMRTVSVFEKITAQLPEISVRSRKTSALLPSGGATIVDLSGNRYALIQMVTSRHVKKGDK